MKKLLLAAVAAVLLASCATNIVLYTDYSPLTQKGYYVSPAAVVPDGYMTIGDVLILQEDGFKSETPHLDYEYDAFNNSEGGLFDRKKGQKKRKTSFKIYNSKTILSELANSIEEKGGDGVIGLTTLYDKNAIYLKGYIIKKK